jgi:hypothetical protein
MRQSSVRAICATVWPLSAASRAKNAGEKK